MITFDKIVTIQAPPRVVLGVIRRMVKPVYENKRQRLIYTRMDGDLWQVYYWQPDGKRATYLRHIVTPYAATDARLAGAPNLIRALDELEQEIPLDDQDAAYERLDAIQQLALQDRKIFALDGNLGFIKTIWGTLLGEQPEVWAILFIIGMLTLIGTGLYSGVTAFQRGINAATQATQATPAPQFGGIQYSYYFRWELPAHWRIVTTPTSDFTGCFNVDYISCTDPVASNETALRAAFSQVRTSALSIFDLEGAEAYFREQLEAHSGVLIDTQTPRTFSIDGKAARQFEGSHRVGVVTRNYLLLSMQFDADTYIMFYAEGTRNTMTRERATLKNLISSIDFTS